MKETIAPANPEKVVRNESFDPPKVATPVSPSKPILDMIDDDGKIAKITFVDGRKYQLQHPGNRKALQWKQNSMQIGSSMRFDELLDKFFQFCVIPLGHEFQPNLDNINPRHTEVWLQLCNRFLSWDLES